MKRTTPDVQDKTTISTSRRNFVKGTKLLLGAGAALGVSAILSGGAHAMGSFPGERGKGHCSRGGLANCFLAGTRIRTSSGLIAVEELRIEDAVLTASGEAKPIKWIGKRTASSERPVKISKFAIDGKAPLDDLYVSPRHSIYIDGFLVPAIDLVNGITIIANSKPDLPVFEYYHIEFDAHEVILAEGLTVESYLPQDGFDFDNAAEYLAFYGPRTRPMAPCAPILSYGNRRGELASYTRSALANVYDMRKPLDKIRDRIADQAELARAA